MKNPVPTLLLTALILIGTSVLANAQWADLKVKVIYDGPAPKLKLLNGAAAPACAILNIPDNRMIVGKDGQLANFAIIMDMRKSDATEIHPALKNPPAKPLVIDNKNCVFSPRVSFIYAGRPVEVTNNDPCGHNYKTDPFNNNGVNILVPSGGKIDVAFPKAERSNFTKFECTIHPWMIGQMIIRDHPYVGISDKDGVVSIEKLPVGKVTFKLVHENMKKAIDEGQLDGKKDKWRSGYIEFELKPGVNEHTLTLAPDLFQD